MPASRPYVPRVLPSSLPHRLVLTRVRDAQDYRSGKMLSGELKQMCIKKLQEFVGDFQAVRPSPPPSFGFAASPAPSADGTHGLMMQRRAAVTDDIVKSYMDMHRKIDPVPGKKAQA